jgi:surfeit locus 1 family protein
MQHLDSNMNAQARDERSALKPLKLAALAAAALVGFATLASLGVWQLHRLAWKRALIQRVEERIHSPAVAAPGPAQWPTVGPQQHEYLRVRLQGRYLNDRETLVQAITQLGAGFWVMTPFEAVDGFTVLINRGFVPPPRRAPADRAQGQIEGESVVTGLVRMSEPGGRYRVNNSSTDQWYSRDVGAICAARGVPDSAPYFIDADAMRPAIAGAPVGGLTVIAFPNSHLEYALTWFALAALLAGGSFLVFRHEWQLRGRKKT